MTIARVAYFARPGHEGYNRQSEGVAKPASQARGLPMKSTYIVFVDRVSWHTDITYIYIFMRVNP